MSLLFSRSSISGPASIPLHEGIINNKKTSVAKGMPFKPDTMDQGNVFSIGRMAFARMNTKMSAKPPTVAEIKATKSGFGGSGFTGGLVTTANRLNSQSLLVGKGGKNWSGASSYIENKRRIAIGKGSMNTFPVTTELTSFSAQDKNTLNHAISKCRGGGCVAPKKKGAVF
jgi:hypothetical protein